jgi:hypothetical protein
MENKRKVKRLKPFYYEGGIDVIWGKLIEHFNDIRDDLEEIKKQRGGKLNVKDHQLTIDQIVKKIYEVM